MLPPNKRRNEKTYPEFTPHEGHRDTLAGIVVAVLLWYFFAWWLGLTGFVLLYWYFAKITYLRAVTAIQQVTSVELLPGEEDLQSRSDWRLVRDQDFRIAGAV